MQALPKALAARGHRVMCIAPRYKCYNVRAVQYRRSSLAVDKDMSPYARWLRIRRPSAACLPAASASQACLPARVLLPVPMPLCRMLGRRV
jgi:hypothetical protein